MADLTTCKEKFGLFFSEDPSRSLEEFTKLTKFYELTWVDPLLSTCCTFEEKSRIFGAALVSADEMAVQNQEHVIYLCLL